MKDVAIVGVGMFPFGKHTDKTYGYLATEACKRAVEDANMDPKEIQTAWYGTSAGIGAGFTALGKIGAYGIPLTRVENACSGSASALRDAFFAIASGMYDVALVMGVEKMVGSTMGDVSGVNTMSEINKGEAKKEVEEKPKDKTSIAGASFSMPDAFAMIAKTHMGRYKTTREQLAKISEKSHKNAAKNPYAQYQKEMSIDEILNSKMVSDPLTIYQCCPFSDGAAAVILTSDDVARKYTDTPVYIAASTQSSGIMTDPRYMTSFSKAKFEPTVKCIKEATRQANCEAKDIDLFEVHDCFSIAEVLHYEDLGLCKKGEGGKFIEDGVSELGGKYPVNPSGGLLSVGHPLGATGARQTVDVVWQLRGEAGKKQVEGAQIGLTHTMGWPANGFVEAMHIFKR